MNGIIQLLKGLVIGVVLLLAIVGLLNITSSNNDKVLNDIKNANHTTAQDNIKSPSININNDSPETLTKEPSGDTTGNTENNTNNNANNDTDAENNTISETFKPEIVEQAVTYGTLKLTAKRLGSGKPQKVNFIIFDQNNKQVAKADNSTTASFQLKTGQYKAIAQLTNNGKEKQNIALNIAIQKDKTLSKVFTLKPSITTGVLQVAAIAHNKSIRTDFIILDQNGKRVAIRQHVASTLFKLKAGAYTVTAGSNGLSETKNITIEPGASYKEVFHLTQQQAQIIPAKVLIRGLDKKTNQPIKLSFLITKPNGQVIKQFNETSSAELSLNPGSYQIKASGSNKNKETRDITLKSGQLLSETFRFATLQKPIKTPEPTPTEPKTKPDTDDANTKNVVLNEPEKPKASVIKPISKPEPTRPETNKTDDKIANILDKPQNKPNPAPEIIKETKPQITTGSLRLQTIDSETKKPIKSNFYVQTINGKNIVNKIYVDRTTFSLKKGMYKITVKSSNKKTVTKTVSIDENSRINRIFSMVSNTPAPIKPPQAKPVQTTQAPATPAPKPAPVKNSGKSTLEQNHSKQTASTRTPAQVVKPQPVKTQAVKPKPAPNKPRGVPSNGSLVITMHPARNHKTSRNALVSDFLIKTTSGKKVALIKGVQQARVKLDVGKYVVTAIHKNKRKNASFSIRKNQNSVVNFNAASFSKSLADNYKQQQQVRTNRNTTPAKAKGVLQSKIVDQHGRPLKGNLTVTNRSGKVVGKANNVTTANFRLPASSFVISLDYRGLNGNERVNIISGETTVQTFTVAQ